MERCFPLGQIRHTRPLQAAHPVFVPTQRQIIWRGPPRALLRAPLQPRMCEGIHR